MYKLNKWRITLINQHWRRWICINFYLKKTTSFTSKSFYTQPFCVQVFIIFYQCNTVFSLQCSYVFMHLIITCDGCFCETFQDTRASMLLNFPLYVKPIFTSFETLIWHLISQIISIIPTIMIWIWHLLIILMST